MLNDAILIEYCDKFLGFGHWNAPIWFIGIEEAGGRSEDEVDNRLWAWDEGGRKQLEDAPRFYPASGKASWHGPGAKMQPTWKQLIRMLLLAKGRADTKDAILGYQRSQLGSANGETCLMELLPFPSPNTRGWNYSHWSTLHWLQSRRGYIRKLRPVRENELRRRINQHGPKVVIFYGLELPEASLLPSWSSIAGGNFIQAFPDERILLWRANLDILFFVTRHPVAESDEYFCKIGRFLFDNHGDHFKDK